MKLGGYVHTIVGCSEGHRVGNKRTNSYLLTIMKKIDKWMCFFYLLSGKLIVVGRILFKLDCALNIY